MSPCQLGRSRRAGWQEEEEEGNPRGFNLDILVDGLLLLVTFSANATDLAPSESLCPRETYPYFVYLASSIMDGITGGCQETKKNGIIEKLKSSRS